jgi:hypothetical protein
MFNDFSKYMAAKTLTKAEASLDDLTAAVSNLGNFAEGNSVMRLADGTVSVVFGDFAAVDAPALARAGQVASEAMVKATNLTNAAAKWASISKVTIVVAKGFTLLAMAAACVCTGIQIANDFTTGQSTVLKVFDILEGVANGVAFLVEAGVGIAALCGAEVCSVIPVIGVVAAVVGVIIAIVTLFIHRKQPPTPEEKFVDDHCTSFIANKEVPDQDWINKQKGVDEHLNKNSVVEASRSLASREAKPRTIVTPIIAATNNVL